jgi:PAS domain S-box-containing protein
MQDLQVKVNTLLQARSEIKHAKTMQEQWLTTLDLFLNKQQSYLVKGIDNQSKQLSKKYQEIATYADMPKSAESFEVLFGNINKITQQLAYDSIYDQQKWNQNIMLSDILTEKLLNAAENLNISVSTLYEVKNLELMSAQDEMVTLAFLVLASYLLTTLAVSWWNSHTLVKPLEKLSKLARKEIGTKTDKDPNLIIDKGPTEIRQLSESLQHYSSSLKLQQRKTAKAHAEELQARQHLSLVMNTAPIAIISTDEKLKILTVNPATESLFALVKGAIIDQSLFDFIPELNKMENGFAKLADYETLIQREPGSLSIEINSANLNLPGRIQYLFMIKDISHRKAQEKIMKALNQQLVQSEKLASIGLLSAGIAHEINNPIGFVKSNIEILAEYFDSFEEFINTFKQIPGSLQDSNMNLQLTKITKLGESLEIGYLIEDSKDIFSSSKEGLERVCKIIEEMKAFTHIEKNEQQEESLATLVEHAIFLTANEVKYKADVVTYFDELPLVKCWKSKLLQVLINLLVNASHAIEESGSINIRVYQKNDFAMIDIRDDGCGISEENMDRIFTPFFTTKPPGKGTGLGLHVTQSIMEKHGGEISAKSEVGVGTCFILSLPLEGVVVESE